MKGSGRFILKRQQILSAFGFAFALLLLVGCSNDKHPATAKNNKEISISHDGPYITFDKETHNFGRIMSGEKVAYNFRFSNNGNQPLLITGIRSGCGCTVGDYPKEPILPKQTGAINVVFNSSGRKGMQSEAIRVLTNQEIESMITLRIQAEVIEQ